MDECSVCGAEIDVLHEVDGVLYCDVHCPWCNDRTVDG